MKILFVLFVLSTVCLWSQKRDTRPNILFAIADDWSFGHAGAYGCKWVKTPAFDRVAREGILFSRAYTPNAKCAPSRAIILTGRNSWQLEEAANHMNFFPAKYRGWVETLAENGYEVGYTGKGWGPGIARDEKGKKRQLTGIAFSRNKAQPPAKAISSNDYATNFIEFLKQAPRNRPWSFWFGTTEPHRGYEYGSGVKAGKELSDIDEVPAFWPDNETVRNDMLDYAVEVEHYDRHLGRILDALDQTGLAENTIVVATSDHGMCLPRCKGDKPTIIPTTCPLPSAGRPESPETGGKSTITSASPTLPRPFSKRPGWTAAIRACNPLPGEASSICSNLPSPVRSIRRGTFSSSVRKGTTSAAPTTADTPFGESSSGKSFTCVISKMRDGPSETRKPDTSTVTQAPSKPLSSTNAETGKTNIGE